MMLAAMASIPLLSARGLVKSFGGRRILDGLDLDVEGGARIGVLGPTGAASPPSCESPQASTRPTPVP
jgi:ABC-2 type transport system ATP-binding protein